MHPLKFFDTKVGHALHDLPYLYDFSSCPVDLIATVPGDQPGRITRAPSSTHYKQLYGPQRFSAVMASKTGHPTSQLPPSVLSPTDTFVIQQTSVGTKMSVPFIEQLARNYFVEDDRVTATMPHVLQNTCIVWPTEEFMWMAYRKSVGAPKTNISGTGYSGTCFLMPKYFHETDQEVLSQFAQYAPAADVIIDDGNSRIPRQPHIKTYARLLSDKTTRAVVGDGGEVSNVNGIAWFMLTSACISRGAQGYM